jgi:DNA-binding XRE family transcriptional regulator
MLRAVVSRFIAIALLLIFSGDSALPALLADSESSLPACCRRDGKHHCAMTEKEAAGPSWRTATRKCPLFPKRTVAFFTDQAAPLPASRFAGWIASHPVTKAQTEALYHISHSRTRQKRGPPSFV